MARHNDNLETFGPEPSFGAGQAALHDLVHRTSIGKTVAAVYLGDNERFRSETPEECPPDGIFRSEFLAFVFTDGSHMVLQVGSGNSFCVADTPEARKILNRAKKNAQKRLAAG